MENDKKNNFKILFITQDDPFYVGIFFNEFFRTYKWLDEIIGVVIGSPMGKKSTMKLARQMYAFYGPLNFLKMGLKYSAYKVMGKIPGWALNGSTLSLTELCKRHKITLIHESNMNGTDFLNKVRAIDPDLIISVAAPVIFKEGLIQLPKFGCINIHNAKLPKYRGMMPNFWQLYHDEKRSGITVHEINSGIDEGRIILQDEVEVQLGETLDVLIKRTKKIGAHLMIKAVDMIKSGNVSYADNPVSEGSYFSFPTKEDVKEFKRRGKRIM